MRALDDVRARLIATSTFRQHLRSNPDALLAVLAAVVTRLRESDRRRLEFSGFDVPQRVSLLLVELAQTHGQPGVDGVVTISLALSQEEIAEATGASREAVAKALRRLREEGTVLTGRRRIVIKRMDRLIGHSEHE
ncbi:hypothetical protein Pa4123_20610 [Phytohabitans aurantiacus]|uniref:HTH crp-type domain-containing protein n=1 Tax=Phytohabitans aurantiacus TaxID=3016789 RepID=A0ABQ5QS23_9ACTN|nr:hypothetical protein Pa4123_20610 [Phytohabitans aurantiacus]